MKIEGLSAVVITYNEEKNIEACLKSLSFAGEIVIVDSGSNDRTVEIAGQFTDKIFFLKWAGYGFAKEFAAHKASNKWVLNIDADERISDELADEIKDVFLKGPRYNAYYIPILSKFMGKWIYHSGWYPGHKIRLFNREQGGFVSRKVHEYVKAEGEKGYLKGNILHYSAPDLDTYIKKLNAYSTEEVESLYEHKIVRPFSAFISAVRAFFLRFFLKKGFLDGFHGLVLCLFVALYHYLIVLKAWEKQQYRT